jgi:hypothetical protein
MFDLPLEYALIAFENAEPTGKIVPEAVAPIPPVQ